MQRSAAHFQAAHQFDFTVGREIEKRALGMQVVDQRGVRQRFQRVVQIDARAAPRSVADTGAARARHR